MKFELCKYIVEEAPFEYCYENIFRYYEYMSELESINYSDISTLTEAANKWHISNAHFTNKRSDYDYLEDGEYVDSYKVNTDWFFSFDLIGLSIELEAPKKISASIRYPDGDVGWVSFDDEYAQRGAQPCLWIGPGNTYSVPGTLTVTIFVDGLNVGSRSVNVTW